MDRWRISARQLGEDGWTLPLLVRLIAYCLRAIVELGCARIRFANFHVKDIAGLNSEAEGVGRAAKDAMAGDQREVDWISFVIPRVAARLPWRSDCLIQTTSAQKWLIAKEISSNIVIGVEKSSPDEFGAHAWLNYGDRIVTGGDISRYTVLLDTQKTAE